MKLPKPAHKFGYTSKQVDEICEKAGVPREEFGEAFGINTCFHDEKLGTIYYGCDIERALWVLGKNGGKYHRRRRRAGEREMSDNYDGPALADQIIRLRIRLSETVKERDTWKQAAEGLQKSLDQLYGSKFRDRCYHALKSRADGADKALAEAEKERDSAVDVLKKICEMYRKGLIDGIVETAQEALKK